MSICAKDTCLRNVSIKNFCTGDTFARDACIEGIYIEDICIADPCIRGFWARNACTCTVGACIAAWSCCNMGISIRSACIDSVSSDKCSGMHL